MDIINVYDFGEVIIHGVCFLSDEFFRESSKMLVSTNGLCIVMLFRNDS